MPESQEDFIHVARSKREVFCYAADVNELHDLEVTLVFSNGELHEVKEPSVINVRDKWRLRKMICQMIENAERRIADDQLPVVKPSSGDTAPEFETEIIDKNVFEDSDYRKLSARKVIAMRRKFRGSKHKDLTVSAEADRLGVVGETLRQALLGKTWKSVNDKEPPLTQAEYSASLARPIKYV